MTTVSIIGTSGRAGNVTKKLYENMINAVIIYLKKYVNSQNIILVSGGAAFADHVAIHIYLNKDKYDLSNINELHLHLPCEFDMITHKFYDNGNSDWKNNSGKVANYYHDRFIHITGCDSYEELYNVMTQIDQSVYVKVYNGFHSRNKYVAKSDYVLAFTFGKNYPEDGGTKYTWDLCKGKKFHISLKS